MARSMARSMVRPGGSAATIKAAWIFPFSGKHCLPPLQFQPLMPSRRASMGDTVNNGVIQWLRQRNVDAVVRRAENVSAGTAFRKMITRKNLPPIRHARRTRPKKRPDGVSPPCITPVSADAEAGECNSGYSSAASMKSCTSWLTLLSLLGSYLQSIAVAQ